MTNREMYQKVFGFPPDRGNCPTESCKFCPVNPTQNCKFCEVSGPASVLNWWDSEYTGSHAIKIEITEHHTFANPDDVSDIKFGDN